MAEARQSAEQAAPPCVHCGMPTKNVDGYWIHERGLARCQHPDVPYGHLGHPAYVPCEADGPNPCLGARITPPGQERTL